VAALEAFTGVATMNDLEGSHRVHMERDHAPLDAALAELREQIRESDLASANLLVKHDAQLTTHLWWFQRMKEGLNPTQAIVYASEEPTDEDVYGPTPPAVAAARDTAPRVKPFMPPGSPMVSPIDDYPQRQFLDELDTPPDDLEVRGKLSPMASHPIDVLPPLVVTKELIAHIADRQAVNPSWIRDIMADAIQYWNAHRVPAGDDRGDTPDVEN
jgi:hypothetical protein